MINPMITFSGKPIDKMSWLELKREKRIQRWFGYRLKRIEEPIVFYSGLKRQELEDDRSLEEAEKALERGEIEKEEFYKVKRQRYANERILNNSDENLAFLRMHITHAFAVAEACQDRMKYVVKPKKGTRSNFIPYRRRRPNTVGHRHMLRKRIADAVRGENEKLRQWQKSLENKGAGALWDREKFEQVCIDRGFMTDVSRWAFVSGVLNISTRQAEKMFEIGRFSWGQVLVLGAELQMTPKEFCDTFMSGYFKEIADGYFEASTDNCPDFQDM